MRRRSINNLSSSEINKFFAQPFKSEKIGKIFQTLLLEGGKLARDLAKRINVKVVYLLNLDPSLDNISL